MPKSIRRDHASGFKNVLFKDFRKNFGIDQLFCPVGDYLGCELVERTIKTIKRKLGTEAFSTQ